MSKRKTPSIDDQLVSVAKDIHTINTGVESIKRKLNSYVEEHKDIDKQVMDGIRAGLEESREVKPTVLELKVCVVGLLFFLDVN